MPPRYLPASFSGLPILPPFLTTTLICNPDRCHHLSSTPTPIPDKISPILADCFTLLLNTFTRQMSRRDAFQHGYIKPLNDELLEIALLQPTLQGFLETMGDGEPQLVSIQEELESSVRVNSLKTATQAQCIRMFVRGPFLDQVFPDFLSESCEDIPVSTGQHTRVWSTTSSIRSSTGKKPSSNSSKTNWTIERYQPTRSRCCDYCRKRLMTGGCGGLGGRMQGVGGDFQYQKFTVD